MNKQLPKWLLEFIIQTTKDENELVSHKMAIDLIFFPLRKRS